MLPSWCADHSLGEDHPGVLHVVVAEGCTLTLFWDTWICFLLDVPISLLGEDHPGVLPYSHGVLHGEDQHVIHAVVAEGYTLTLFWDTRICFLLDVLISLLGEDHHGVLHGEDQPVLHVIVAEGYTLTLFLDTSICCFLDVLISLLGEDHPGVLPHSHGVLHGEDQHVLHVVVTEGCTLSLFWGTWICFLLDGLISLLGEDHPGVLPHSHGLLTVVVEHAVVTVSFLLVNDGVHVHCTEL